MATFDPTTTEARVYQALESHLRAMAVPEEQWLEVKLYVRLDTGGGMMAASLSVQDTGSRSMAFTDRRVDHMTSLTDTGVQIGQLGPEPEPYKIPEHAKWPSASRGPVWSGEAQITGAADVLGRARTEGMIQAGIIEGPVQGAVFEAAGLREQLRQMQDERDRKEELLQQLHSDLVLYFGSGTKSVYQAYMVHETVRGELASARQRLGGIELKPASGSPTQSDLTDAWQDRALRAETERDNWEYQAGRMQSDLRQYFGSEVRTVQQAYLAHEQIVGEREAAIQQRDEASALALRSLELLRMVPTASMSEDVEVMHHALVASPRTSETEALLEGYLSATVDHRASGLVRDRLAEYDEDQRTAVDAAVRRAGDAEARAVELESRVGYQRARGWCEMGLVLLVVLGLIWRLR